MAETLTSWELEQIAAGKAVRDGSGIKLRSPDLHVPPEPYRVAILSADNSPLETVRRYLPANYVAVQHGEATIYVIGQDNAGWTLDDYVLPRLASGLHFAQELKDEANLAVVREAVGDLDRACLIGAARGLDALPFEHLDGPGQLDGSSDRELTVALDVLVGRGDGEEVGGDIETVGLHCVRFGRFILTTDSQGFLDAITLKDEAEAVAYLAEVDGKDLPCPDCDGSGIRSGIGGSYCRRCEATGTVA